MPRASKSWIFKFNSLQKMISRNKRSLTQLSIYIGNGSRLQPNWHACCRWSGGSCHGAQLSHSSQWTDASKIKKIFSPAEANFWLWFGTSLLNKPAVNHWVAFCILVLFPINWRNCPLYCSIWLEYTSLLPAVQYSFWEVEQQPLICLILVNISSG